MDLIVGNFLKWNIVLNRALMGFIIGISGLKMKWWLHGIVIGIIASIPMSVVVLPDMMIAISTVIMGMIYGFLTELITSILFKANLNNSQNQ